jgi:cation-transporting ATPase E
MATHSSVEGAVRASVASVVSMVPEGLVLLTSLALAVGIVRLGRRRVLVQELAALEGLARVDVLCIDKTGTLTEPGLEVSSIEPAGDWTRAEARAALGALAAADPDPNASMRAIAASCPSPGWTATWRSPFSSARRSSATTFRDRGSWVLGAAEALVPTMEGPDVADVVDRQARAGRRVLVLTRSQDGIGFTDRSTLEPVAVVAIEERVRPDASATLAFFAAQGVALKVLSGDDPRTVGAVAARVGVPGADEAVEASTLPSDPGELAAVMDSRSVFGRVDPRQKQAMVAALQARGHVVAMTGDGVNDVLALKQADLGVAMGSGSPATRAVAQLVLLDSSFAALPHVVAEGRRVIGNVERVANLFLTKTVYATLLAVAVGAMRLPFPFLPRHLTVISALTIGIPGFFLALAPQQRRAEAGLIRRVLRFAVPAGGVTAAATMAVYGLALRAPSVSRAEARTAAAIALFVVALWVLGMLARPASPVRAGLVLAMAAAFVMVVVVPSWRAFFAFDLPRPEVLVASVGLAVLAAVGLEAGWRLMGVILRPLRATPARLGRGVAGRAGPRHDGRPPQVDAPPPRPHAGNVRPNRH